MRSFSGASECISTYAWIPTRRIPCRSRMPITMRPHPVNRHMLSYTYMNLILNTVSYNNRQDLFL